MKNRVRVNVRFLSHNTNLYYTCVFDLYKCPLTYITVPLKIMNLLCFGTWCSYPALERSWWIPLSHLPVTHSLSLPFTNIITRQYHACTPLCSFSFVTPVLSCWCVDVPDNHVIISCYLLFTCLLLLSSVLLITWLLFLVTCIYRVASLSRCGNYSTATQLC